MVGRCPSRHRLVSARVAHDLTRAPALFRALPSIDHAPLALTGWRGFLRFNAPIP